MGEKAKSSTPMHVSNVCKRRLFPAKQARGGTGSLRKMPIGSAAPGEAVEGAALVRFGLCPGISSLLPAAAGTKHFVKAGN